MTSAISSGGIRQMGESYEKWQLLRPHRRRPEFGHSLVILLRRTACAPRSYDQDLYKTRHLIENFSARL